MNSKQVPNSGLQLGNHQLTIKLIFHVILVILVHIELGLVLPRKNASQTLFDQHKLPLGFNYFLWVLYFVHSSL